MDGFIKNKPKLVKQADTKVFLLILNPNSYNQKFKYLISWTNNCVDTPPGGVKNLNSESHNCYKVTNFTFFVFYYLFYDKLNILFLRYIFFNK